MKNILKMIISSIIITSLLVGSTLIFHAESYSIKAYMDPAYITNNGGTGSSAASNAAWYCQDFITKASYVFQERWGVTFTINGYYPLPSNTLPWESCPNAYNIACNTTNCGSSCVNNVSETLNHHKNGFKNWTPFVTYRNNTGNDIYLWATSANICYKKNNTHSATLGGLSGNNCIMVHSGTRGRLVSNPMRLLQHEISHYFGVSDNACSNQDCIMSLDFYSDSDYLNLEIWCDNCLSILNARLG